MFDRPQWQCCFCGERVEPADDVRISLRADPDEEESYQEMHCHRECLRARVLPSTGIL